jgi:hypothetical protein
MKLIEINKNGTQKFKLKDGRFIYSYTSGYVRIDSNLDRLYQINQVRTAPHDSWGEVRKRILIPCPEERFQYIVDWVDRNVKNIPYAITRDLKNKTGWIKFYTEKYGY